MMIQFIFSVIEKVMYDEMQDYRDIHNLSDSQFEKNKFEIKKKLLQDYHDEILQKVISKLQNNNGMSIFIIESLFQDYVENNSS